MKLIDSFCFICGRVKPAHIIYNKNYMSIIRCCDCHTLSRPREEHDRIKPINNASEYYRESIRCALGNRLFFRETFEDLIKKFPFIKNGNFLDFGCGIGNSLLEAKQLGFNVFGIELSWWAIEYCNRYGFEVMASLEDINRKQVKFDLINLNHILEHISDPINSLNKLKEFLKEKGILRIKVPNCSKFFIWRFMPECKYVVNVPNEDHIYYFSVDTLKNILSKAQLEIIDIHTEGFAEYIRHKATMLNPNIFVRILSYFLYFTRLEEKLKLESFLVAIAKKK